jgi:hypothetical protein
MVVGTPYKRPTGLAWNTMFAVFFVLGGVCSTLIPLTYGSSKHSIGTCRQRYCTAAAWLARCPPPPPRLLPCLPVSADDTAFSLSVRRV